MEYVNRNTDIHRQKHKINAKKQRVYMKSDSGIGQKRKKRFVFLG